MTPQELLKDIESKNYEWSSEDVMWLIARCKQLESKARSVLWIGDCRCDHYYTRRGLHEPNSYCGELDELKEALDTMPEGDK